MPIYTVRDSAGTTKKLLIDVPEFLSYQRDPSGNRVYTGDEFPEGIGEKIFLISSSTRLAGETRIPAATRKFGDSFTSPSFGRKSWE